MHFHRQGAGKLPLECKKSRTVGCVCMTQDGAHRRPPGGRFITQNPPPRDEIRTASLLSSETNDDGSGVGQGDLRDNLGPATERWTLEMKKEKNPSKEALDATPLAQFFFGPGRR